MLESCFHGVDFSQLEAKEEAEELLVWPFTKLTQIIHYFRTCGEEIILSQCDAKIGLPLIADMYYGGFNFQPVEAFVGPGCSVICEPGGLLMAKWGIPMVSYGSTSSKMSDKTLYPTFARAQAPNSRCAPFFVQILQQFGFYQVAIIFYGKYLDLNGINFKGKINRFWYTNNAIFHISKRNGWK